MGGRSPPSRKRDPPPRPRYSTHVAHNTATVPASLDTHRIPRHQNIAAWSKDTKFILFTEHAPAKALAVPVIRIHLLTTILREAKTVKKENDFTNYKSCHTPG